jgi:hypothetical protein
VNQALVLGEPSFIENQPCLSDVRHCFAGFSSCGQGDRGSAGVNREKFRGYYRHSLSKIGYFECRTSKLRSPNDRSTHDHALSDLVLSRFSMAD